MPVSQEILSLGNFVAATQFPSKKCRSSTTCSTCTCTSLAGQPLLTQKARKGLVNEVTSACPRGMYITSYVGDVSVEFE